MHFVHTGTSQATVYSEKEFTIWYTQRICFIFKAIWSSKFIVSNVELAFFQDKLLYEVAVLSYM